MFSALIHKEWRQLRALRWAGVGLGALIPLAFLGGAEAAHRGWAPLGIVSSYTFHNILLELVPWTFALGLWPLAALLTTAQSFCGDRANGTEMFLLERPVTRRATWWARLLASSSSAVLVALGSLAVWLVFVFIGTGSGWRTLGEQLRTPGIAGLLGLGVAFCGGVAAASLLAAPLASVLLGLVMAAIPVGLGSFLVAAFPHASYRGVSLGLLTPWVLFPTYPLLSYVALCRGEPSGRGRGSRVALTLGPVVALISFGFVLAAPVILRLSARQIDAGFRTFPSPAGGAALIGHGYLGAGGYLIDLAEARPLRFLPPPLTHAAWSPDGHRLAVVSHAGPFGAEAPGRLRFLDPRGQPAGASVELGDERVVAFEGLEWAGELVSLSRYRNERTDLAVISPESGEVRQILRERPWGTWGLAGPTLDGRLFVAMGPEGYRPTLNENRSALRTVYNVYPVDLHAGRIGPQPLFSEPAGFPFSAPGRLSPSGRFWVRDLKRKEGDPIVVRDLVSGSESQFPGGREARPGWLADDSLILMEEKATETRLMVARPGEPPRVVGDWSDFLVTRWPSPDLRHLFVHIQHETRLTEYRDFLFDPASDRLTEVSLKEFPTPDRRYWTQWAGPRTLARMGPGVLALEDIDSPGTLRFVFGGPE